MITEGFLFAICLIILVTASVSLGFANKCSGNLNIIKNTNYFLIVMSLCFMGILGWVLYEEYKGSAKFDNNTMLPMAVLIGGISILQMGILQYSCMQNINCGDSTTQNNIANSYIVFMSLGLIMSVLGFLMYIEFV